MGRGPVLVAGGMGFIGSHFVRHLRQDDPERVVVNLDKLTYAGRPDNLADLRDDPRHVFVQGDICNATLVAELLKAHRVEAIVNLAAETHVDRSIHDSGEFLRTNVEGTRVLLEAARASGVRLYIQVSTDEVYGSVEVGAASEESPLLPNSPYAASKAGADSLVRAYHVTYGVAAVVTRGSNTYGPNQFPEKFIPLMIINALRGEPLPIYGDGRQIRDWLHVSDHCRALARVLAAGRPGAVYNVGAGDLRENIEVARRILALTGRSPDPLRHVPDRPGHDRRYAMATARMREALGWTPQVGFDDGLAATVDWYQNHRDWWEPILAGEFAGYYRRQYGG